MYTSPPHPSPLTPHTHTHTVYDDTLIHHQLEPLPFKLQKHTTIDTTTPTDHTHHDVVHRRMSLPDPAESQGVRMNGLAVGSDEEDRRASTGGVIEVPIIMPTSPGGASVGEGRCGFVYWIV